MNGLKVLVDAQPAVLTARKPEEARALLAPSEAAVQALYRRMERLGVSVERRLEG